MLIIGGNSLIGTHIKTALAVKGEMVEETKRQPMTGDAVKLDLMHAEEFDPGICQSKQVIFCAAATNMLWCEDNPEISSKINVHGTRIALNKLTDNGFSGVFLSSSQVFNGEENLCHEASPTHCKNLYGEQKLEIERYIVEQDLPFAILRLSKIMGKGNLGIFDQWTQSIEKGLPINAATNIYLSPVCADDAAEITLALAQAQRTGIWHLSAPDQLSYAEAAVHMAEIRNHDIRLIHQSPVTETNVPSKFIARFTALNCQKLRHEFGFSAPSSKAVIETLLRA